MTGRRSTPRSRLAGAIVLIICLSPLLVGAINLEALFLIGVAWLLGSIVLMWLTIYPPRSAKRRNTAQNLTVALSSLSIMITLTDLALRWAHPLVIYYRPEERFMQRYPPMPLVLRYAPNIVYKGPVYGDLAAIAGKAEYRQVRTISFRTDAHGFRNPDANPQDIDVIVLGDSFGVGMTTSEEATWANLLREQYGLSVYNLSTPASSPWHEYINLMMEIDRLDTHEGTVLLWLLFSGNDLDEDYYEISDPAQLPKQNALSITATVWRTYIKHSPLGIMTLRVRARLLAAEEIADHFAVTRLADGRPVLFSNVYFERQQRDMQDILNHANYPRMVELIQKAEDLARSRGMRLVLVVAPSKGEVYPWLLNGDPAWTVDRTPSGFAQAIEALSRQEGICYLDLKPALIDASQQVYLESGELLYWRDDTHWNDYGNAVVARYIYESLFNAQQRSPCRAAAEETGP